MGPVVKKKPGNWSFFVVDLQRTAKKCTKNYIARAQPLFCSLNLLIGDVLVTVAVLFCARYVLKFENAAWFLLLGPSSTLIRHENGAFRKRSSNRRNLRTPAFRFCVDGKHFENGAFRNRRYHDNHVIFLPEFSSDTNPKWPVIVALSNFSGVVRRGLTCNDILTT